MCLCSTLQSNNNSSTPTNLPLSTTVLDLAPRCPNTRLKFHHKLPSLELRTKTARRDANQSSALAAAIHPLPTKEAGQTHQFPVQMSAKVQVESGGESSTTSVGNRLPRHLKFSLPQTTICGPPSKSFSLASGGFYKSLNYC